MTNEKKYAGMTVNERLWVSGLFYEYESAVERKDRERATEILRKVELDDETIRANLDIAGMIRLFLTTPATKIAIEDTAPPQEDYTLEEYEIN